ncbi:MAG: hypothetical protein QM692_01355 [Thermomicrobiales bacterium]
MPTAPSTTAGACTGGAWTPPTVTANQGTGYTAVVTQDPNAGNNWTYIVTATAESGYGWGNLTGTGWVKVNDTTATYTGTVVPNLCKDAKPIAPTAIDGACRGGVYTPPSVTANQGEGYTAEVTQQPNAGNNWQYVVTATIKDGYVWNLGAGWMQVNSTTATYTGTVQENPCKEAVPVAPTVTADDCIGGKVTASTITPVRPRVSRTPSPSSRPLATVGPTRSPPPSRLAMPGDLTGSGWIKLDDTTATFAAVAPPKPCIETIPAKPTAVDGTCLGGVWTPPSVTAVQGAGYTATVTQNPNAGNSWTYIVTATIAEGYSWDDLAGSGWVKVNDSTASYTGTVKENACIKTTPIATATDGSCTGGAWTAPTVTANQGRATPPPSPSNRMPATTGPTSSPRRSRTATPGT